MKYVIISILTSLLLSTNGYAEMKHTYYDNGVKIIEVDYPKTADNLTELDYEKIKAIANKLPECPPQTVVKYDSVLPDWAWVGVGIVASSMVWGTFWYTRGK